MPTTSYRARFSKNALAAALILTLAACSGDGGSEGGSDDGKPAKDVTINDALPTGAGVVWSEDPDVAACEIVANTLSCDFGDLAAGASRTVHVSSPTTSASCTRNSTATVVDRRSRRARARLSRSTNSVRLGNAVSGSCRAWWASTSATAAG